MRALVIVLLLLAIGPIATAQPRRPITIAHEFHVSEASEPIRTLKQMNKLEFEAILNAGCASLGQACRDGKEQIRPAASVPGTIIAEGESVYITGRVVRQEGEQWWGIFDAPKGYAVCRAALSRLSLTEGSIFNTRIERGSNFRGLSFYAVVPAGRQGGGNRINAYFLVNYVPIGTEARLNCMPGGSNPWLCQGTKECQRIVGSLN